MSYVEIFRVSADGDVTSYDSAPNNHHFAPLVWEYLTVQYGLHPTGKPYDLKPSWHYEPLWRLFGKGKLERKDELLLGATFDRVWVPRALIPELLEAMLAFHERYIVPSKYTPTIKDSIEVIQHLMEEDPELRGVAFNMCSANDAFWNLRDEDGKPSAYNIDKAVADTHSEGKSHWELKVVDPAVALEKEARQFVRTSEDRMVNFIEIGATSLKLERMPTLETAKAQMADAIWVIQKILATQKLTELWNTPPRPPV